jgi:hypothetical protein
MEHGSGAEGDGVKPCYFVIRPVAGRRISRVIRSEEPVKFTLQTGVPGGHALPKKAETVF